jgi:hypothetical protein
MTVLNRVRQTYCALHGHDNLLEFRQDRLLLKCVSCDHETPGWELRDTAPKPIPATRRVEQVGWGADTRRVA